MSRFVAAGTNEDNAAEKDAEWTKVQQELEANRARKAEPGTQEGGKSLYEVLQANKAAKQDAFEESIRLKNQFRSLDDHEVEFLESVLETSRTQEEKVRKETAEELDSFRKQREEAERVSTAPESAAGQQGAGEETWITKAKKRRKVHKDKSFTGLKLRKTSSGDTVGEAKVEQRSPIEEQGTVPLFHPAHEVASPADRTTGDLAHVTSRDPSKSAITSSRPGDSTGLALVAYSSDDEP